MQLWYTSSRNRVTSLSSTLKNVKDTARTSGPEFHNCTPMSPCPPPQTHPHLHVAYFQHIHIVYLYELGRARAPTANNENCCHIKPFSSMHQGNADTLPSCHLVLLCFILLSSCSCSGKEALSFFIIILFNTIKASGVSANSKDTAGQELYPTCSKSCMTCNQPH